MLFLDEINSLALMQLTTSEMNREILMTLHKPRYNIAVSIPHERDLDKIEVYELVNKI